MTGEASNKKTGVKQEEVIAWEDENGFFVSIVGGVLITQYAIQSTVCLGGDLANKQAVSL